MADLLLDISMFQRKGLEIVCKGMRKDSKCSCKLNSPIAAREARTYTTSPILKAGRTGSEGRAVPRGAGCCGIEFHICCREFDAE